MYRGIGICIAIQGRTSEEGTIQLIVLQDKVLRLKENCITIQSVVLQFKSLERKKCLTIQNLVLQDESLDYKEKVYRNTIFCIAREPLPELYFHN